MKSLTNKQIIIITVVSIIVLGTIGVYFYKNVFMRDENDNYEILDDYGEEEIQLSECNNLENAEGEIEEKIVIHITGCIKNQGIVILDQGDRIVDAIERAGGATDEADLNKINLAYELQDGEKLYIPSKNDSEETSYLSSGESHYVIGSTSTASEKENAIVNINKATKEQLQTLNGIGESMANKIIQYRKENGGFENIEDIKNVPGIGDAKFNGIKDNITVK